MATQTLAQAKLRINDEIVSGVVEDIITTNPIYQVMPFTAYAGQAILVNREDTLGDAQHLAIGGTITAKAASTAIHSISTEQVSNKPTILPVLIEFVNWVKTQNIQEDKYANSLKELKQKGLIE